MCVFFVRDLLDGFFSICNNRKKKKKRGSTSWKLKPSEISQLLLLLELHPWPALSSVRGHPVFPYYLLKYRRCPYSRISRIPYMTTQSGVRANRRLLNSGIPEFRIPEFRIPIPEFRIRNFGIYFGPSAVQPVFQKMSRWGRSAGGLQKVGKTETTKFIKKGYS